MVAVLGTLLALGLLGIGRLTRGLPLLPPLHDWLLRGARVQHTPNRLAASEHRTLIIGAAVGLVVVIVARNLVFGVIVGAGVVLWPMVVGGGKAERAALAKLEALAHWTEALRDLAQKGSGLESVIPRTVDTASDVLVGPLRLMSRRLSVKVPLPEALSLFADEVDDASADTVVAALALSARQRRGRLSDVLSTLSEALRDELEQRTKVMRERNVIRREAAQVAVLTGVLVTGASLFAPPSLPVDDDGAAQILPLLLAIAFVVVFSRVRKLAEPEPQPRFLSSATDVLEAATYRPKTSIGTPPVGSASGQTPPAETPSVGTPSVGTAPAGTRSPLENPANP